MHPAKSAIVAFTLLIICQIQDDWWRNNFGRRLATLKSAVQKHPESAKAHYELGAAYLKAYKALKAIETLKQAIQIKPDFAEAYCKLGQAYHAFHFNRYTSDILHPDERKAEHPVEEIEALNKAIEVNPEYAEAYFELGNTYVRFKDNVIDREALKQAMVLFNRAIEIKPDYKEAYRGIRSVYLFQHDDKDVVMTSKQIILLDSEDDRSYKDLTDYCQILQMCDEVIEAYKEIISVKPDNGKAYAGLGKAYFSKQQYDEALDALKQAVEFSPGDQFAHFYLGLTYLKLDNKEAATQEYRILRKLPKAGFPVCVGTHSFDEDLLSRINK